MAGDSEPTLPARQRARLAARLTELRALAGLSANGLAEAAGLGQSTVHKLLALAGEGNPKLSTMLRLVEFFELRSVEELLGETPTRAFLDLRD